MSKKRGLSLEEKKDKVLEIFHESRDVFLLKDIEKLAVKKGVIQQSVKEVLQALVDDDLVHSDKIGISNFFWSFPSEAAVKLKNDLDKHEKQLSDSKRQLASLQTQLEQSRAEKAFSDDRAAKLSQLTALQQQAKEQESELAKYAQSDPETLDAMNEGTGIARDSANRWLDNLEMLKSWCRKRFEGMDQQLDEYFAKEGAGDLDYL
ncbi:hypothetical protein WJX73_002102 [Symbiochloris irregularis]|uniref:Meiotic nuclear division protein 1 homolog n=1 Tax=Symbiochloris irregularis TaxID=706552 RepID=A0AAW1PDW3_9CHLO